MGKIIKHGERYGKIKAVASKSFAHRMLICSALYGDGAEIYCEDISKDIEATMNCLEACGFNIEKKDKKIYISKGKKPEGSVDLYCSESGSTLRFMIPVIGVLGIEGTFHMEGRLSERPLGIFKDELEAHGMEITQKGCKLFCKGKLKAGKYSIPGNISSQYISGLLMALPKLEKDCMIEVTGDVESYDYIRMTLDVLLRAGIEIKEENNTYNIKEKNKYSYPKKSTVEGDWSNATFFLCMGALSEKGITVMGLDHKSSQGDKRIIEILRKIGAEVYEDADGITVKKCRLDGFLVDARPIPDMIPAISVVAAVAEGVSEIKNASRLRLKESDRIKSVCRLLEGVGADVEEKEDGLVIRGKKHLKGGKVSTYNDHRIAMAAAVCACICEDDIILDDEKCVAKSYPDFWEVFEQLDLR